MSIITRAMNPIFSLLALDIITRQVDQTLLTGTFGLKIPVAARAAISLGFNLFRLKISARFTKGLPFGLSTFANLATRLSALQIALQSLPIFFNPKNYLIPGTREGDAFGIGLPQQDMLMSTGFNIGDFVEVIVGADSGHKGSITGIADDGIHYFVSGTSNQFLVNEIRRI